MTIYYKFEHRFPSVGEIWVFCESDVYIKRNNIDHYSCVSKANSLVPDHSDPGFVPVERITIIGTADRHETLDKTQQLLLIDEIKRRKVNGNL